MIKYRYILSIESSCDDACVCIFDALKCKPLSNLIATHMCKKGIIPENVARTHVKSIPLLVKMALKDAQIELSNIDVIGATFGPGLLGSLMTGLCYAKGLAWSLDKPFIAAHHIEGHILSVKYEYDLHFPYGCLVISGGHTLLCVAEELGQYKIIGKSIDDAVGECFDKVAREIGLEQPGGPAIENLAKNGMPSIDLPQSLPNSFDFSFSGLKSAAKRSFNGENASDVAASLLNTVGDCLANKINKFCRDVVQKYQINNHKFAIGIVGGVAANRVIYHKIKNITDRYDIELFVPSMALCTDNALMIAYQVSLYAQLQRFSSLTQPPISKMSIENI